MSHPEVGSTPSIIKKNCDISSSLLILSATLPYNHKPEPKVFSLARAAFQFWLRAPSPPSTIPSRLTSARHRPPSPLLPLFLKMAFNPLSMLAERTCGPIYNAIDTGNNLLAIRHADKILSSQPDLVLASALKALALQRSGRRDEASALCTSLVTRGLRKGEENALTPLTWCLGRLGRRSDEIALLEAAVKNDPNSEDLARQTFFALIKCQMFQKAQQLALKMHKSFSGRKQSKGRFADEYFWWSILSYLLLARDTSAPGAALALPLSQRMIEKQVESKPLTLNDEEALCLLLQVLIRQGKKKNAFDLVSTPSSVGHTLCDRNLSLEFTRMDLAKDLQDWAYVESSCLTRIEAGSRNWAHFTGYLDTAEKLGKPHIVAAQKKINVLLSTKGATKDRSIRLAELEVRRKLHNLGEKDADTELFNKVLSYFDQFGNKACCHEDLLPYLSVLSSTSRTNLSSKLATKLRPIPIKSELDLRTNISIAKITRTIQPPSSLTEESEAALAASLLKQYLDGLSVGSALPETEMQPADDLALLSTQALLSAYRLSHYRPCYLLQSISLLEFALTKSPKGYQLRMLLIRSYVLAGAYDRAVIHYNLLKLKSVQSDTLSHLISDRCSAFSSNTADESLYKLSVRTLSASQGIYEENSTSIPEMISKALEHGIYSRVEEFVTFGEALDRSLQRQVLRLEEARSHLYHRKNWSEEAKGKFEAGIKGAVEKINADLKGGLSDQRDFTVLVNYQPLGTPSVEDLTRVGPRVDAGWVRSLASTLSSDSGVDLSETDMTNLTSREKDLIRLTHSARSTSFDQSLLISLLEKVKSTVRSLVTSDKVRPVDAVLETALALEAVYHTQSKLSDESRSMAKTHLAELATLVNHLLRAVKPEGEEEGIVLQMGLEALGKEKVEEMLKATRENVARSCGKVFGNLRDSLRNAL